MTDRTPTPPESDPTEPEAKHDASPEAGNAEPILDVGDNKSAATPGAADDTKSSAPMHLSFEDVAEPAPGETLPGVRRSALSDRTRAIVYPLLLLWAMLLIGGLAYYELTKKDDTPNNTQQQSIQQLAKEEKAVESQNASKESAATKVLNGSTSTVKGQAVVGKNAPLFNVPGIKGSTVKLKNFRGSPVVVEFFATWCPHCRKMAPVFDQVLKKYPDVKFITINSAREPHSLSVSWHKTTLPGGKPMNSVLGFDDSLDVARAYKLVGYPTTAFINHQGGLVSLVSGEMTAKELNSKIAALS